MPFPAPRGAHTAFSLNDPGSRKESAPQVLLPEEEKIIVEETKSNGQTVIEEKSLVDTVYALKDEVQELRQVHQPVFTFN